MPKAGGAWKDGGTGKSPIGMLVASAEKKRPTFAGKTLPQQGSARFKGNGRINLRAVSEVLQAAGMDPAEELVRIVKEGKLPLDIQARVLNELLQYTQPKLKSVEVRAKVVGTGFDINDAQAKRIAEEFLKAAR
jgi:hypothetical protein